METLSYLEDSDRFLDAESRVAQWSVGGAMFGLTAAVVQMLIRSLVVKRAKEWWWNVQADWLWQLYFQENRRIDRIKSFKRRKGERRIESSPGERSPIVVDDYGGVVTHVFTYPYIVPVYYNLGKYDLNNLNKDYHHQTESTESKLSNSTSSSFNPWDRLEEITLPSTLTENLNSVFALRQQKQIITEKDPEVIGRTDQRSYNSDRLKNHRLNNYYSEEYEPKHHKITRKYLKKLFRSWIIMHRN